MSGVDVLEWGLISWGTLGVAGDVNLCDRCQHGVCAG